MLIDKDIVRMFANFCLEDEVVQLTCAVIQKQHQRDMTLMCGNPHYNVFRTKHLRGKVKEEDDPVESRSIIDDRVERASFNHTNIGNSNA